MDAGLTRAAREVTPFLVRQVTATVHWTDCVARMAAEGCQGFVELGPGKS